MKVDRVTAAGMALTALAAAVASASALAGLAVDTGWQPWAGWLLPCSIDVLAGVAVRVWLDASAPDPARRFARLVTFAAVAVSMTGNAAAHLVTSGDLVVSWSLVVIVGALPAAALGTVVHLHALRTAPVASRRRTAQPQHRTATRTDSKADTREDSQLAATSGHSAPDRVPEPGSTAEVRDDTRTVRRQDNASTRDRVLAAWQAAIAAGRTPTNDEVAEATGVTARTVRRYLAAVRAGHEGRADTAPGQLPGHQAIDDHDEQRDNVVQLANAHH